MKNLKLSSNELKLMEIIWKIDKPLTSIDLHPYTKDWKNGYLQNVLKALENKGMLQCIGSVQYKNKFAKQYVYTLSREAYAAKILALLQITKDNIPLVITELEKTLEDANLSN